MQRNIISAAPVRWLCTVSLIWVSSACEPAAIAAEDKAVDLSTDLKRGSYLLGYDQARQMAEQTAGALDLAAYLQGVTDHGAGREGRVEVAQMEQAMLALREAVSERRSAADAETVQAGVAFREAFAAQDGVVSLPSGLLYQVIQEGSGEKPEATDTVVTHYHGTLIDGRVFDSSVDRGEPASFPVNRVISGWTEALQLMSVGSKWRLVIPPDLAYGDRGAGDMIGPKSTLVFEVELLEIK